MTNKERTKRDRIYISLLKNRGPLSPTALAKEALNNPAFQTMSLESTKRDIGRRAQHFENLGLMERRGGVIHLFEGKHEAAPRNPYILGSDGVLTSRAGVTCIRCGQTIDLSKAKVRWRLKSRLLNLALHVHHFIRVTCYNPDCEWEGRYDTMKDVKPILPD